MIAMGGAAPQFLSHMAALALPPPRPGDLDLNPPNNGNLDELLTELEEQTRPFEPFQRP